MKDPSPREPNELKRSLCVARNKLVLTEPFRAAARAKTETANFIALIKSNLTV
jgi:hypothetical protein